MKSINYITHEEIRQRAHQIWEQSGRPEGQETDHWLRAERELQNERERATTNNGNTAATKPARENNGRPAAPRTK